MTKNTDVITMLTQYSGSKTTLWYSDIMAKTAKWQKEIILDSPTDAVEAIIELSHQNPSLGYDLTIHSSSGPVFIKGGDVGVLVDHVRSRRD